MWLCALCGTAESFEHSHCMLCGTPRAEHEVAVEQSKARTPLAAPAGSRAQGLADVAVLSKVPEPAGGACGDAAQEHLRRGSAARGPSPCPRGASRSRSYGGCRGGGFARETGMVKSWIFEKQFGFVSSSSKNRPDLFLHVDNIKSLDQRERAKAQGLRCGDRVAFHIREAAAGNRSDNAVDAEVLGAARPSSSRSPSSRQEDSWWRRRRGHKHYEEAQEIKEWQCWRTSRWIRAPAQNYEVLTLPVGKVRFTQESVKHQFSDGQSFEDLLAGLESGRIDPLKDWFLELRGFQQDSRGPHHPAVYYCLNNRRLHCLQEFQARHPERKVLMKLWVQDFEPEAKLAIQALTTVNGGTTVRVRGPASS